MAHTFTITQAMVDSFVGRTGDRNAQHTDEQFARRFRYRRRVVHGMLSFAKLFESVEGDLVRCDTRFLKPAFVGDTVAIEVTTSEQPDGVVAYEATWRNAHTGEALITSKGGLRGRGGARMSDGQMTTGPLEENVLTIEQMAGAAESFGFCAAGNADATLLLSTLVGMRLPGRYATFTSFQLEFDNAVMAGVEYRLRGDVEKVTVAAETANLAVSVIGSDGGRIAHGKVVAIVSAPPRPPLLAAQVKERYVEPGLRGKVALVTGSSRGIGAATAKLLAMHGSKVVVNYHKGRDDADEVVADIRSAGGEAIAVGCDVSDEAQVRELFRRAVEAFGGLDVLVNNAVKDFAAKDVADLQWDDYLSELQVSLKGVILCSQQAIGIFRARAARGGDVTGGKIVNLSTIAVDVPVKGQSKYITAKSAVIGFTRSLAREVAGENIQVNVVAPNMTETDLVAALPSTIVKRIAQARPGGRNLEPIQVAQAVVFLASQWSNSMTGQKVVLNLGEPPFT